MSGFPLVQCCSVGLFVGAFEGSGVGAFVGLVDPGDEVLLPNPAWPNFAMMATLCSAVIKSYPLTAENGFLPDIDALEALVSPATSCC